MISGRDFIVFSDDWGRHPFSCQHVMKHFLPGNRLLWVHTVGMRRPRLTLSDLKRSIQKLRSFAAPPSASARVLPENLYLLDPPMLPFGNPLVLCANKASVVRAVREKIAELELKNPVFLTTLPNASEYVGSFDEACVIYYCVDDFCCWPGVNEQLVRKMERRLLERCDLLLCSSEKLAEIKHLPGLRTEILPHGVDYGHFARCMSPPERQIAELEGLRRPVVGYFGLFGAWVDQGILLKLATERPDWTLLIIGNVIVDTTELQALPNVRFIGPVPYEVLPDYISHLDLLVLPYLVEGRGQTITPLKLREYVATGKPVVSTAIPECVKFSAQIGIADDPGHFLALAEAALAAPFQNSEARSKSVYPERWEVRAERFSSLVDALIQSKRVTCPS